MATYVVTRIRRSWSADGGHRHITGVVTESGTHFTREEVVASIDAGNAWLTGAGGRTAVIYTTRACPHPGCAAVGYLKANPESTDKDNLENLDEV